MTERSKPSINRQAGRYFLTDRIRPEVDWSATPQSAGEPLPPVQKPVPAGADLLPLPQPEEWHIPPRDLAAAIAAYRQDLMDALLEVDGEEEFTVYLAPVGKV